MQNAFPARSVNTVSEMSLTDCHWWSVRKIPCNPSMSRPYPRRHRCVNQTNAPGNMVDATAPPEIVVCEQFQASGVWCGKPHPRASNNSCTRAGKFMNCGYMRSNPARKFELKLVRLNIRRCFVYHLIFDADDADVTTLPSNLEDSVCKCSWM